jgi:thymidylate synthase
MMELAGHSEGPRWRWRKISPRGQETWEHEGLFVTEYLKPDERVLFSEVRDANPYFHFFESLWILAGRQDVEFLAQFLPRMADFSDDGTTFHAAYGYRLRKHFGYDQLLEAVKILRKDHDTRQVVLQIWDAKVDMTTKTKDRPCNDFVFLKIREDRLHITVGCRSNDLVWGAYGANAVQFSVLQEFLAASIGVGIGTYTQISDSFHVYTANDAYQRLLKRPQCSDLYSKMSAMRPYPLMDKMFSNPKTWLDQLEVAIEDPIHVADNKDEYDSFFVDVMLPMWESWVAHKNKDDGEAIRILDQNCAAYDWSTAAQQWLKRRIDRKVAV